MISEKTAWVVFPLDCCIIQISAIINTQHYFKTYPARCRWPKIGPGAIQSMAYCC